MQNSQGRRFFAPFKTPDLGQSQGRDILTGLSQPSTQGSGLTWSIVGAHEEPNEHDRIKMPLEADQTQLKVPEKIAGPKLNTATEDVKNSEQETPMKTIKTPKKRGVGSFRTPMNTNRKLVVAMPFEMCPKKQVTKSAKAQAKSSPSSRIKTGKPKPVKKAVKVNNNGNRNNKRLKARSKSTVLRNKKFIEEQLLPEVEEQKSSQVTSLTDSESVYSIPNGQHPPKSAIYDFELSPETVRKMKFKKNKQKAEAQIKQQLLRTIARMQEEMFVIRQRRDVLREIIHRKHLEKQRQDGTRPVRLFQLGNV